jgi:hypothetical protein
MKRLWRVLPWGHFRSDSDLEDELRVHREMQTEDNLAAGMSRVEADRRARLRLGRAPAILESIRDQDFMTTLESCYREFVLGLRALRKSPVFCLTAGRATGAGVGGRRLWDRHTVPGSDCRTGISLCRRNHVVGERLEARRSAPVESRVERHGTPHQTVTTRQRP